MPERQFPCALHQEILQLRKTYDVMQIMQPTCAGWLQILKSRSFSPIFKRFFRILQEDGVSPFTLALAAGYLLRCKMGIVQSVVTDDSARPNPPSAKRIRPSTAECGQSGFFGKKDMVQHGRGNTDRSAAAPW